VIPPDAGANYIDRNIRLLVGHVKSRERLAELDQSVCIGSQPSLRGKRVLVLEDRLLNQTLSRSTQEARRRLQCSLPKWR